MSETRRSDLLPPVKGANNNSPPSQSFFLRTPSGNNSPYSSPNSSPHSSPSAKPKPKNHFIPPLILAPDSPGATSNKAQPVRKAISDPEPPKREFFFNEMNVNKSKQASPRMEDILQKLVNSKKCALAELMEVHRLKIMIHKCICENSSLSSNEKFRLIRESMKDIEITNQAIKKKSEEIKAVEKELAEFMGTTNPKDEIKRDRLSF